MTLPVSGAISFNNINVELGVAGTTQASLGQASYRTLAGVPSGQISMSNFYGKANQFAFAIASNQTNANLRTLALNAGWNGTSKVVATINSGVYCSSNSTGTPGLTVNGSFPGGVELINNGFIIGMGGAGGTGSHVGAGGSGANGGQALSVSSSISITNNGTIGGGGGGGGGGGRGYYEVGKGSSAVSCGSGGGGGRTGATNSSGGSRTSTGLGGLDGNPGTSSAAGASADSGAGGFGAAGGGWGASGGTGGTGATYQTAGAAGGGGGSGGAAVSGNGNITWLATGTRLGAIS